MNISRLFRCTARKLRRDGFTLVELLVVIGIIAILAGVALGPITSGIEKAKESSGLQTCRSINLLCFSYANDNNQTYLPGSSSAAQVAGVSSAEAIASALLNGKYANDATVFAIISSHKYSGSTAPYSLASTNVDWDFVGGSSSTGLTSSNPDQTPVVFSHLGSSGSITGPSGTTPGTATIYSDAPFALYGVAVAYKSNSAAFLKGAVSSASAATVNNFISTSFTDSWSNYSVIKP